ncbi:MAG: GNAT family N-acetyltransferase [Clostridiales bacterium]|nr:GNAT family N-acetyltransferase [Clostridiales bacterium]
MIGDLTIRLETPADYREVEYVTREAFWNHYVPGCDEHFLAHVLRESNCFISELDFVAVQQGRIVGNIMYTNAKIAGDDGAEYPVVSFGPISVLPEWQGNGVGSALILRSLSAARRLGHTAVLIYGDPAYYSRFGFVAAEKFGIATSDDHYADALQALELKRGSLNGKSGCFLEDHAYEVDTTASALFDKNFPPKDKLEGLPSQLKFLQHVSMRKPRR